MNATTSQIASLALKAALLALLAVPGSAVLLAQSIPATVEDVVKRNDLIVLGRVTKTDPDGVELGESYKMLFTRHAFGVEAYYKGTGSKEISLFTPGGLETQVINGKEHRFWTSVSGAEGTKEGEEFLAFLRAVPGGYVFIEWDGAKYPVTTDPETDERTVGLRLRKKQYMKGSALQGFERLEKMETDPNPATKVQDRLRGTKGMTDIIRVEDLPDRLGEIIRGEGVAQSGP